MAWDLTYQNTPLNGDDPGEGALELRTLKQEIAKRGDTEHYWGDSEEDLVARLGAHKEGSARVTVVDEYPSGVNREDPSANTGNAGSVTVNYTDKAVGETVDGDPAVSPPDEDTKDIDIKVRAYDDSAGTLVTATIYDKAKLLNLAYDQTIGGRKTFELNPNVPQDPAIDVGGLPYGQDWFVPQMDSVGDGADIAVALSNARNNLKATMLGNDLDPDDAIAQWLDTQLSGYIIAGGVYDSYVAKKIKIDKIYANEIHGAVWAD